MPDDEIAYYDRMRMAVGVALIVVSFIFSAFFIALPLFNQAASWLRTGAMPERDLFWATASDRCEATQWYALGWEGKDLCRPDSIHFTEWVGANEILNYVFDVNIAVVALIGLVIFWQLVLFIFDSFFN